MWSCWTPSTSTPPGPGRPSSCSTPWTWPAASCCWWSTGSRRRRSRASGTCQPSTCSPSTSSTPTTCWPATRSCSPATRSTAASAGQPPARARSRSWSSRRARTREEPPRRDPQAGGQREVLRAAGRQHLHVRGPPGRQQDGDQGGRPDDLLRPGDQREHPAPQGQAQAHPAGGRRPQGDQARAGDAAPRRQDRDLRGQVAMGIRKQKPTTPGRRGSSVSDFVEITRGRPEKSLLAPSPRRGGRNVHGRITTRHQGGGHKQRYRVIDFRRDKDGVPARVAAIEYDPNRTAHIALLHYADGEKRYIIAPNRLRVGDVVESGEGADIKPGNALPLKNIPVGTIVHNVELRPGGGAKLSRSAGAGTQLLAKEGTLATLRLPSGEIRQVQIG